MAVYVVNTNADTTVSTLQLRRHRLEAVDLAIAVDTARDLHRRILREDDASIWVDVVSIDGMRLDHKPFCDYHGFAHSDHPDVRVWLCCKEG